jgi:hypothetical protein
VSLIVAMDAVGTTMAERAAGGLADRGGRDGEMLVTTAELVDAEAREVGEEGGDPHGVRLLGWTRKRGVRCNRCGQTAGGVAGLTASPRTRENPCNPASTIVSPEEWNGAQVVLQRNKERAPRNNRKPEAFLLRGGFVRCGHGGGAMTVGTVRHKGEGEYVYRCGRGSRPGNGCTHHGIRTHILDAAVWNRVRVIFTDPAVISRELETLRRDNPTKHDLAAVERSLAEVMRQQENLSRSLAALDDPDAAAPVIGQLKALGQRRKELEAERKMVTERGREWETTQANLDDLTAWCGTVGSNFDTLTYTEKRAALDALGIGVTLYRADHAPRYVIEANIPLGREIVNTTSSHCAMQRAG